MDEQWCTFPTQIEGNSAIISCNFGYAEVANDDPRKVVVHVVMMVKNPSAEGMPEGAELASLIAIEDGLTGALTPLGAAPVGCVTLRGRRIVIFYVDASEDDVAAAVSPVADASGYTIELDCAPDPEKSVYWDTLYPTTDDWQLMQDMNVLSALRENGDRAETPREVTHWAYFAGKESADAFVQWITANGYALIAVEPAQDSENLGVNFSHVGTMVLEDISNRTILLDRKVRELGGEYDGWETSVET